MKFRSYLAGVNFKDMKNILTFFILLSAMKLMSQTTFIAHRGASFDAPENTVASAKLAWELGADAVEVDIHISKDNRIMVIHDSDTKRTCTGKKNLTIADSPSTVLRDLDAGSWKDPKFKGEKIPFLTEIAETIPDGKSLVVEIKCGKEVLPPLNYFMEKYKKNGQIVYISFDWNTLLEVKRAFPEIKCYWLSSSKTGLTKKIKEAAEVGFDGVNLKSQIITEDIVAVAKENNIEVLAWTVDDPAEAKRLIDLGVTKLTTNRPAWLKEELEKQ